MSAQPTTPPAGAEQQQQQHLHKQHEQQELADVVTQVFAELKHEIDTIMSSSVQDATGWTQAAAAREAVAQAILQLHGRTVSETPGYDDYELPHPILTLPPVTELEELHDQEVSLLADNQAGDVLATVTDNQHSRTAADFQAAAASMGVSYAGNEGSRPSSSTADVAASATACSSTTAQAAFKTPAEEAEHGADESCSISLCDADIQSVTGTTTDLLDRRASVESAAQQPCRGPQPPPFTPVDAMARLQAELELQQELGEASRKVDVLMSAPAALHGIHGRDPCWSEQQYGQHAATDFKLEGPETAADTDAVPLSYRELLDRALAWNPRVKGAGNSISSSMHASTNVMRHSASSASARSSTAGSTASSRRQRPKSAGRPARLASSAVSPPPDYRAKMQQPAAQQGLSKFPAGAHSSSHFSLSAQVRSSSNSWSPAGAAAPGAVGARIFKEQAPAAQPGLVRQRGTTLGPKVRYRSKSAPREEAAAYRHIQRMSGSPTRVAAASRDSILGQQLSPNSVYGRELHSRPPTFGFGSSCSSEVVEPLPKQVSGRSPESAMPMRLTQDEWHRVHTRLNQDAASRQGARQQQELAAEWQQQWPSASSYRQRVRSPVSPGSDRYGSGAAAAAAPLDPEFYRRQNALLRKRAELAAKKRPSDEDDLNECTFHPHINPSSRSLRRSVEQLHAWDARRKLTVFAKALDRCESECEGYTFAPSINPLSRQLALAHYAVSPDPARPWTTNPNPNPQPISPRHSSPSPEAVRILREALPPANVLSLAGPTAQHKAEGVLELLGVVLPQPASASGRVHPRSSVTGPLLEPAATRRPVSPGGKGLGPLDAIAEAAQEVQCDAGGSAGRAHKELAAAAVPAFVAGVASAGVKGLPPVGPPPGQVMASVVLEQEAAAAGQAAADEAQVLLPGVVLGIPVQMPTLGVPVSPGKTAAAAAVAAPAAAAPAMDAAPVAASNTTGRSVSSSSSSSQPQQASDSAMASQSPQSVGNSIQPTSSTAAWPQAASTAAAAAPQLSSMEGDLMQPVGEAAAAAAAAAGSAAPTEPPAADAAVPQAVKGAAHNTVLDPQLLLAALKVSPVQAQLGLEEGKAKASRSKPGSGPGVAERGSSSGGMAPGTPVLGSLGGSSGDSSKRVRDDSAGGMYSATLAKKLSGGSSSLLGAAAAAAHAGHKGAASPLSRAHQGSELGAAEGNAASVVAPTGAVAGMSLQELAQHLSSGGADSKALATLRQVALQTVPAYFYSTASEGRSASAGQATNEVRRGTSSSSSYSQKYQARLSKAGVGPQDPTAAVLSQLPTELLELMNSLAVADGNSSSSPPDSPSFAQLKATWLAKELAALEAATAAAAKAGTGGSQRPSVAGGGQAAAAAAAAPAAATPNSLSSEALLRMLSSSLVAAPDTPTHSQLHPFASSSSLLKQYSTAQVLNARARHSSSAGGAGSVSEASHSEASHPGQQSDGHAGSSSSNDGDNPVTAVSGGSTGAAALQPASQPDSDAAAGAAAATAAGDALEGLMLLLPELAAGNSSPPGTCKSLNGSPCSPKASQQLAACSSILSLPDTSAAGVAPVASESCNGCPQARIVQKVEVLLEGTRSVPFELVLSPRSRTLIAGSSSLGGVAAGPPASVDISSPLGQHLLQLMLSAKRSEARQGHSTSNSTVALTYEQWQALLQQQQQHVGQKPAAGAANSSSTSVVDAVTQLLAGDSSGTAASLPPSSAAGGASGVLCASTCQGAAGVQGPGPSPSPSHPLSSPLSLLRPSAASPHLVSSGAASPVWGSPAASRHQLTAAAQQQQQQPGTLAATAAQPSFLDDRGAHSGSCPSVVGSAQDATEFAARPAVEATVKDAVTAALSGQADSNITADLHGQQQQQQQQGSTTQGTQPTARQQQQQEQPADAGAADLAAELVSLLQSAGSLSPEEKADRVARTFAKTISRLNMSSDVLQQTIAALDPSTEPAATPTAGHGAPHGLSSTESLSSTATGAPAAAQQVPSAATAAGGFCDVPQADSIQQLLECVSQGMGLAPQQVAPVLLLQQQQQQQMPQAEVQPATCNTASPVNTYAHVSSSSSGSSHASGDWLRACPAEAAAAQPGASSPDGSAAAVAAAGPRPCARSGCGTLSWAAVVAQTTEPGPL